MSIITDINKAFDHRIRLGIMSVLMVNESASFKELKEFLGTTDGNLASHAKALEKEAYVSVHKAFIGRKPNTSYRVTPKGKNAFKKHIQALENLLKSD